MICLLEDSGQWSYDNKIICISVFCLLEGSGQWSYDKKIICILVICLLEGSGQWPDDKNAFKRVKAALHIKLGEILSDQHSIPVDHVDIKYVSVRYLEFIDSMVILSAELPDRYYTYQFSCQFIRCETGIYQHYVHC